MVIHSQLFKPSKTIQFIKKYGKSIYFKKNEFIYLQGDKNRHLYLIESGEVFISLIQDDGRELIIKLLNKENIFGATHLFSKNKELGNSARVKTQVDLKMIEVDQLKAFLNKNDEMHREWMEWLEIENIRFSTKMRDLFLYGKNGALTSTLIRLANSYGEDVDDGIKLTTKLTNEDIALMCGTTREGINRALSDLKQKGIVSINQKTITIHHIQYLRNKISCDRCEFNICQVH